MQIKAIQTRYAGHLFRSRLEARYAVMFDALGIEWEYEVEGFDLPSGWRYLPDFWLPQVMMWAEVKAQKLNAIEFQKAWELAQGKGFEVLLLDGRPAPRFYTAIVPNAKSPVTESCFLTHYDIFESHRYWANERRFFCEDVGTVALPTRTQATPDYRCQNTYNPSCGEVWAIEKANSARFEFGDAA